MWNGYRQNSLRETYFGHYVGNLARYTCITMAVLTFLKLLLSEITWDCYWYMFNNYELYSGHYDWDGSQLLSNLQEWFT